MVATSVSSNNDMPISKLSLVIPPWALPTEEITLYVKIKKNLDFLKISIILPDCFKVKDLINVEKSEKTENGITIFDIGRSSLSEYDYFGVTIASVKPFDDLAVESKISVVLVEQNGMSTTFETHARIFRPSLKIDHVPAQISINSVEETTLPINLKFEGFGDISIRIECDIGGSLVSEGGRSIMDRVFHGFLREGLFDSETENIEEDGITIDRTKLVRDFEELKIKLKDSEYIKSLENDKEITSETIEWLKSFKDSQQEKFMNVFYDTMEGYMIKKLTDIVARNISRHLQIDSGTNIITEIETKLANLRLRIFYRDLAGNTYPPLETSVEIIDNREPDSELHVVIPIEVKKVDESGAYKDVSEMDINNVS